MQEVYAEYERTTREHIVDEVEQALAEAKVGTAPRVPDGATVTGLLCNAHGPIATAIAVSCASE